MENVVVVAAAAPSTFQNGNAVISPLVSTYAQRYRSFLVKSAEAILGLAQTLMEAKETLDEVELSIFLDEVNLKKGSPTYSKLLKIGEALPRFQPFIDKLPNTWTTVYELSKLEPRSFDRIASSLNPFITAKEIKDLLDQKTAKPTNKVDLSLIVADLDTDQKSKLYEEIKKLKERFHFCLTTSDSFVEELKSFKNQKQAA